MSIKEIANVVLLLMQLAEYIITGTKKGAERKESVIAWFYALLPAAVTKRVSREQLDGIIESSMSALKKELADAAE